MSVLSKITKNKVRNFLTVIIIESYSSFDQAIFMGLGAILVVA